MNIRVNSHIVEERRETHGQHVYPPCPAMFIRHGVFLHDGGEAEQRELLQQAELAC